MKFNPLSVSAEYGGKDAYEKFGKFIDHIGKILSGYNERNYGNAIESMVFIFRVSGKIKRFEDDGFRVTRDKRNRLVSCDIVINHEDLNYESIKSLKSKILEGAKESMLYIENKNYEFNSKQCLEDVINAIDKVAYDP